MRNPAESSQKKFLALTAQSAFWKKDSEILFLGEWCRVFKSRETWQNLNHSVLPYPWDDRKKLYSDFKKIGVLYEKKLVEVSQLLNQFHSASHSVEHWRKIVGPWLHWFISILYDRYLCIEAAENLGVPLETWIPKSDVVLDWTPNDFRNFSDWMAEDGFNLYIYGEIIRSRKKISFETPGFENLIPKPSQSHSSGFLKKLFRKFLRSNFYRWVAKNNRIVFVASYLSRWDQIKLHLALGQVPYLIEFEKNPSFGRASPESRAALKLNSDHPMGDDFESLLDSMIPRQMPVAYLEGHHLVRDQAIKNLPKQAEVMITAVATYGFEEFNLWATHLREKNQAKLVIEQHGGMYGAGLWLAPEDMELSICDRYFSWGWKDTQGKVVPLPSGRLNRIRKKLKPNPTGNVLLCSGSLPRYAYFMYGVPVGPQMLSYISDQVRFFKALSSTGQKNLLHRLYPKDLGWNEKERYAHQVPAMQIADGTQSFFDQLNQARLFVGNYNATTFLETFAADFPTVLFWDPNLWELRASAEPIYRELERAKILHFTPESAAHHVSQIFENPQNWWNETSTQAAKDRFCQHFALSGDDWIPQWVDALKLEKQSQNQGKNHS